MKNLFLITVYLLLVPVSFGQSIQQKLQQAYRQFEADSQMKHAISSLYVINAKTGETVFDKNSQVGLAAASTQKIITAATAFELLGKDYRYKTVIGYTGEINKAALEGDIYIIGSGDPTFGSRRYAGTNEKSIFEKISNAITSRNIKAIEGYPIPIIQRWDSQITPDGWIWQDIGNYYGAGASGLNWRENQFDIKLKSSDKIGTPVSITGTDPKLYGVELTSELRSAGKNSGDNAYIYLPSYSKEEFIRGTIPISQDSFVISGAIPNPQKQFVYSFFQSLSQTLGTSFLLSSIDEAIKKETPDFINDKIGGKDIKNLYTHYSPTLDSIVYWFLKKSINLYGEALIKTFAYEKRGFGSTDSGVVIIKDFWKQKGLDEDELNLYDGSGLSPLNRITTHAQVEVLKYAKTKDWFSYFYNALPEFNGMKMKSGTISDVKAYCGYQKSKDGKEYIFSFIINNYNGPSSGVVNKMYKVLDLLK